MFYSQIKKAVRDLPRGGVGDAEVAVPKALFEHMLRSALRTVDFDEKWYLAKYGDVAHAVKSGVLSSGREHYVTAGYFENRLPRDISVDEKYYLGANDDVARAVREKRLVHPREHWMQYGMWEGRPPSPNFTLFEQTATVEPRTRER